MKKALNEIGVTGMTVLEVQGFGRQKGHTEIYRGAEYVVDFPPRSRSRSPFRPIRCRRRWSGSLTAAHTGKIGDGKIFASTREVVRIRNGRAGA